MTKATKRYECGKCNGTGRIEAFGHYDNGKCFGCAGAGWVVGLNYGQKEIARMQASYTVGALEDAAAEGVNNPAWITHMCKRAAGDLLRMSDTAHARVLLARLPLAVRAEIIAHGRDMANAG